MPDRFANTKVATVYFPVDAARSNPIVPCSLASFKIKKVLAMRFGQNTQGPGKGADAGVLPQRVLPSHRSADDRRSMAGETFGNRKRQKDLLWCAIRQAAKVNR
jgi:hypothetical protein